MKSNPDNNLSALAAIGNGNDEGTYGFSLLSPWLQQAIRKVNREIAAEEKHYNEILKSVTPNI